MPTDLTRVTTSVLIDPNSRRGGVGTVFPAGVHPWERPALYAGPARIEVDAERDTAAAAWWRTLADAAEQIAAWYDTRTAQPGADRP